MSRPFAPLMVWRDWIDQAADDPRHELAFHAQLSNYSRELRQEGGSVTTAWPGAGPLRPPLPFGPPSRRLRTNAGYVRIKQPNTEQADRRWDRKIGWDELPSQPWPRGYLMR